MVADRGLISAETLADTMPIVPLLIRMAGGAITEIEQEGSGHALGGTLRPYVVCFDPDATDQPPLPIPKKPRKRGHAPLLA